MRIIKTMRRQRCVYWPLGGEDDQGQRLYGTAVELQCRWVDIQEEFLDYQGNTALTRAKVYVDRDVEILGVLWLPPKNIKIGEGEAISQLTSRTQPFTNNDAWEIRRFDKLPELNPRKDDPNNTLRTAYL